MRKTCHQLQQDPWASCRAAVGCEAGEAERVASALQLRLTFAKNGKRTMKKSDLSATARMYALEVKGQDSLLAQRLFASLPPPHPRSLVSRLWPEGAHLAS